jgi:hypothetical protein
VPHVKRRAPYGIGMTRKEIIMDNLYSILADWYPNGDFTESDLWDAIAESEGTEVSSIMDGDLTDYL